MCEECKKQIAALIAENERLTNRLEVDPRHDYDGISTRDATVKVLDEQVDQLKAENEALREDARRHRWLRDSCGLVEYKAIAGSIGPGMLPSGEALDAAIDAAMGKGELS